MAKKHLETRLKNRANYIRVKDYIETLFKADVSDTFQNDRFFVLTKKQAYGKSLGEGEVWSPATPIVQMLCYPHICSHHCEWTTRIALTPLKEQPCVL